ncbi:MAG: hypothetical protein HQK50_15535 [Oligoflexia bacterium]|nr:hypothetical protein [Oligoflexia bacterium]MBF0366987.1 hypothetical protein [Oligoflexia bacterium]
MFIKKESTIVKRDINQKNCSNNVRKQYFNFLALSGHCENISIAFRYFILHHGAGFVSRSMVWSTARPYARSGFSEDAADEQ